MSSSKRIGDNGLLDLSAVHGELVAGLLDDNGEVRVDLLKQHQDSLAHILQFHDLGDSDVTLSLKCQLEVFKYGTALQSSQVWALKMLDSNDLFPGAGLLEGNLFHYPGSMHECLSVSNDTPGAVSGKYWMLTSVGAPGNLLLSSGLLRIGRCFPSACTPVDVVTAATAYINNVTNSIGLYQIIPLDSHTADESVDWNGADIFMMVFLGIIFTVLLLCTLIDVLVSIFNVKALDRLLDLSQGFSVYTNLSKLFNTNSSNINPENNLSCLNGIRAISISWVVLGHTYFELSTSNFTGNGVLIKNLLNFQEDGGEVDDPALTAVWNGPFSVDSFFLMGATLLAFHTLREMDKNRGSPPVKWVMFWGMFYVHRYIRLSSVYAITIGLHATLLKMFATGPTSYIIDKQVEQCENGWWLNLLYINNFVKEIQDDTGLKMNCMGWTWYLANDMQFFIITPIILYVLWKNLEFGLALASGLLVAGTLTPFMYTWEEESQFIHGDQETFYKKPWNRFQPYIMGLVLGTILHRTKGKKLPSLLRKLHLVVWAVAAGLALVTIYGPTQWNLTKDITIASPLNPDYPNQATRAFYNGFSKISWSLAVAWVIFACVKGLGGLVNSFLSWEFWIPLARLSYCIYLVQYTVIYWNNSQQDYSLNYSNRLFAYAAVSNFALCAFIAMIFMLLFEAPFLHLEKLLFGVLGVGKMPKAKRPPPPPAPATIENKEKDLTSL